MSKVSEIERERESNERERESNEREGSWRDRKVRGVKECKSISVVPK